MQIAFAASVLSPHGEEAGTVKLVLIDPTTGLLSHLVASPAAGGEQRAIPIWAVERADGYEVFLKVDAPEMERLPAFASGKRPSSGSADGKTAMDLAHEPGDFPALFPEDGSLPRNAVAVGEQVRLLCNDDAVAGRLVGVEADDYTAEATILYVRLQGEASKTVSVPAAWARSLTGKRIKLECTQADLQSLPDSPLSAPESPAEPLQRG